MNETADYDKSATPTAHKATHQNGGSDKINIEDLSGELADEQKSAWSKVSGKPAVYPPAMHQASHELFGSDEIDVSGLRGELAWKQPPKNHAADHKAAGDDDLLSAPGAIGGATPAPGSFTTIDLTGGQIAFPATAVPSSDPNTIDAYEEASWVPGLQFGGGSTGITYNIAQGFSTKIGREVFLKSYTELTNKGTDGGVAEIKNLPFMILGGYGNYGAANMRINNITFGGQFQVRCSPGTTTFAFEQVSEAGGLTSMTHANFSNNSSFMMSGFYSA